MKFTRNIFTGLCAICFLAASSRASDPSKPVTLAVTTTSHGYPIPIDFAGLGFETKSEIPNSYGVSGYFFTPSNTQAVTLLQNMGVKDIRIGGGTVDGAGVGGYCANPIPAIADIDSLFQFAEAAGINVVYSFRLLNPSKCANPNLASDNAAQAQHIWNNYAANLNSFSIGNEPDWHSYHTYTNHPLDPAIYETVSGTAGSAYPSYLSDWKNFASAITGLVSGATFSGPDTGAYNTSTYTPNSSGVSWTQQFAGDEKSSGTLANATQHHYVGGSTSVTCGGTKYSLSVQQAIDNMLSPDWVTGTSITAEPHAPPNTCGPGGANGLIYTPYPWLYANNLAPVVSDGVPYRMTEANDYLGGVAGASNGYAAALWALDYMQWWAAHNAAGINFHNNPWLNTDTIVPNPNPCSGACGNYQITPKGYAIKAFDLGGHGYVEPVGISFPGGSFNMTAYAVGEAMDTYVTIINKTHLSTNDITDALVTVKPNGFTAASAAWIALSNGDPGNASSMTATIGGGSITNNARWVGTWTPLSPDTGSGVTVTVPSTSAAVVRIHAASAYAGPIRINQNGALEMFATDASGSASHSWQKSADIPNSPLSNWSSWTELPGVTPAGGIATVKNLNNTLEAFASTSGDVYHTHQLTPGGGWSEWTDMGSASSGITGLQAANNADGSLIVFGIGSNGDLWYASESAPGVGWSNWTDLSGEKIQPGFVVGENLNGLVEVFGADSRGTVWHNWQTASGGWSGWNNNLSGQAVNPRLAIARNLDGRLELFGADSSGNIWHNWQTSPGANTWNGWSEITGKQLQPGFVVGQNKDGRLVLFGVSTASPNDVFNIWQQGSPGGNFGGNWTDMGGSGMDPQLVVSTTLDGRMQLFGVSSLSPYDVWSDWQPSGAGWNGWTDFGNSGMKFYSGQP